MSNMTVNGLTIKNSNIALSPTGGNAPRSVVSVDGAISLANGIGLAVKGNNFSLPIAAYTASSPTHVSAPTVNTAASGRSEEHTSELQSPCNLVCRLLLEKKNKRLIPYQLPHLDTHT